MPVTIAIPFYNAEEYLSGAIKSVFAQTYQDWELILLNDGSTDQSLKIAESIKDKRVRVISDGHNKKLATLLNEITSLAKYDFIARMDADDLMAPDRIEMQMKFLEINKHIDLVTSGLYSVKNDLSLIGKRVQIINHISFEDILNKKVAILHAGILARKSWYQRNRYDENLPLAQDTDLWMSSSKKSDLNISILPYPLYIYREENNITSKKMLLAYKNERRMFSKYIEHSSAFWKHTLLSYTKSVIVFLLTSLNGMQLLHSRRYNHSIDQNDFDEYKKIIALIHNTEII